MAKKKKKSISTKPLKIFERQQYNNFFKSAEYIINALCGKKMYSLIPQKTLDFLYQVKYPSFKIKFPEELKISNNKKRSNEQMLWHFMKEFKVKLLPSDIEIDGVTFSTVWRAIEVVFNEKNLNRDFIEMYEMQCLLKPYILNFDTNNFYFYKMEIAALQISCKLSTIDKIVTFEIELKNENPDQLDGMTQFVVGKIHKAQWKKFKINDELHSACQVGGKLAGFPFQWIKINAEHFYPDSKMGKLPIEVFIQQHAMQRLFERLAPMHSGIAIQFIPYSTNAPKIFPVKDKFYLEYNLSGFKVGYFVGRIVDGVFVIQTFLFLTNKTTPEGEKLEKILKLKKEDVEFLQIDKLDAFFNLNEKEIDELRPIFASVGCDSLFEFRETFDRNSGYYFPQNAYSGKIKNYLSVNTEEEFDYCEKEENAIIS